MKKDRNVRVAALLVLLSMSSAWAIDRIDVLKSANEAPDDSPQQMTARLQRHGSSCRFEQPSGYPHLLVATATTSVQFGSETSLYLLEKRSGRWKLVLEQTGDGQMGLEWRVSSAAGGEPFLITASTRAAEWGVFQPLRLKVLRIGSDAAHPRVLLDSVDSYDIDEPWLLSADGDSFELRYRGSYGLDARRWGRIKVRRYVVRGNHVTRVDPVAESADAFVDEWVSLPWKEAQRWSSGRFKQWHDRLHARKNYHPEVDFTSCVSESAGHSEVTIWIEPKGDPLPDQLVALVERDGDRFLMRDLGPDAEWDETLRERVQCPRKDLVLTSAGHVEIVLKEGLYVAGPRDDFACPTGYGGNFVARVSMQDRTVESSLGIPGVCGGEWTLSLADYNHDGQLDFNIGFQENVVNSFYGLFTIGRDGRVSEMKVRHADGSVDNSITAETTGNSTEFEVTSEGIRARSLSNPADPAVAFWTTLYLMERRPENVRGGGVQSAREVKRRRIRSRCGFCLPFFSLSGSSIGGIDDSRSVLFTLLQEVS